MGEIEHSSLPSLKQVNDTPLVCKKGDVNWDIEDFYGIRWSIVTEAYFVSSVTNFLFSQQVYFDTNSIASITLHRSGFQLILTCGIILYFPISHFDHLSFMLTQNSLDKGRKPKKHLKM